MNTTVLKEIIAFLFGRKYYANIVCTRGTTKFEICSFIFLTIEDADNHRSSIEETKSFRYIETISFRARKDYLPARIPVVKS